MKNNLILIGGGGHCRSCIDVIELENKFKIKAIVDLPENIGKKILGYTIQYRDKDLESLVSKYKNVFISLGQIKDPSLRINTFQKLQYMGAHFPKIISPRAYVSPHAQIGEGTIVMHDAIINANAKVMDNSIINTKALIEHDAFVGSHCHIATGAIVNGDAKVFEGSFVGSNAVLKQGITIGKKRVIPAGERMMNSLQEEL
ncbi:acetyltransferase [Bacteriovoracales bacterium]|nr:acetyltransferase [Bacteriovoracales bacterium]